MDQGMTRKQCLSLSLQEDALSVFEAGGSGVVSISKHGPTIATSTHPSPWMRLS